MTSKKLAAQCAKCRRAGEKLFLKGEKCFGPKCPILKRNYPPGQHGADKKHVKVSGYGRQLKEKQKIKRMYGLMERQFANYVAEASRKTGDTSKFLMNFLESRLDNAVYRMGLGKSREEARQLVSHGHLLVNDRRVNIPSYRLRVGDTFKIKPASLKKKLFENITERLSKVEAPAWLAVDAEKLSAKVLNEPTLDNANFDAKAIIEFYSR